MERWERWAEGLIVAATFLAFFAARPYAGSWNDGSRLASVESLIDRHAWRIDDSIFVRVPPPDGTPLPYPADNPALLQHGTLDKLFIGGHYYSDKSPTPALMMASFYQLWKWATGWTARGHADRFCRDATLASSGVAYVAAVWCIYRLARRLRLTLFSRLALTASFALATVALPYAQHVNNHILLLAVASALTLGVAGLREETTRGRPSKTRLAALGTLAGLGYGIDLGVGPVLLLCTAFLLLSYSLFRCEPKASARFQLTANQIVLFGLAALPWLVLHHALNYAIGGSWKPANANPEYFRWPGSPFAAGNLTGSWVHRDVGSFLLYAASMIAGKRGFLGHNLPLFLTIPAFVVLIRRHRELRREVLWALGCCVGAWLLYAAASNNSSGQCLSIRWFVPLLAPAYYVLALLLRHEPRYRTDFLILSAWGILLALLMHEGPWITHAVPLFWPIQAAALVSWALYHYLRTRPGDLVAATQHPYTNLLYNPRPQEQRHSRYG
jgi:hypothetical protein